MCKEQGYNGVRLVIKVHSMYRLNLEGFQKYLSGTVAVTSPRWIVNSFAVLLSALLCGFNFHKDEFWMTLYLSHIITKRTKWF